MICETAKRRFAKKFKINEATECWEWQHGKHHFGHGSFWFMGRGVMAHRFSWEAAVGPIPDGMCVCHKCDNPSCVNPEHLFLGSRTDNNTDRDTKGRQRGPRGSASGSAKITKEIAERMRAEYGRGGSSIRSIGRKYGLTFLPARNVVLGLSWRD